jgi:hypothetical protein
VRRAGLRVLDGGSGEVEERRRSDGGEGEPGTQDSLLCRAGPVGVSTLQL